MHQYYVYLIYLESAVYTKDGIEEILNLQPKQGKAKAYQVKQVREVILKYELGEKDESAL